MLSLPLRGGAVIWHRTEGVTEIILLCGIYGRNIHVLADVAWQTMFLGGQGNRIMFLGGIYGRNSYGLADLAWCTTLFTMWKMQPKYMFG